MVLSGYGQKAVEVEVQSTEEATPPVSKPKFSWGVSKTAPMAPVDLLKIVSEQEAEKERLHVPPKPGSRRDSGRQPFDGYRRRAAHRRPLAMPATHDRLLTPTVSNRDSLLGRRTTPVEGDSRRSSSGSHHRDTKRSSTTTSHRTDLLCIHPVRHSPTCHLPHSLEEWTPKLCKYKEGCSRKAECSFWHMEMESKREYLTRVLRFDSVFLRKNRNQYLRTYKITL